MNGGGPVAGARLPFDGVAVVAGTLAQDERGVTRKLLRASDAAWNPRATPEVLTVANPRAGTVRGLHYQAPPYEERKAVWVSTGEIWDVLLDLRAHSTTHGRWQAFRLSAHEPTLLIVPEGIAHGYQTLTDGAVVSYLIDGEYVPSAARTVRPTSAMLGIPWPLPVGFMSPGDAGAEPWTPS